MELVASCISDMEETGEKLPEPIADRHYSGKFLIKGNCSGAPHLCTVRPDSHRNHYSSQA